jgi:polyprenyl-phospho-N-acetylgalactosaminyl synthase
MEKSESPFTLTHAPTQLPAGTWIVVPAFNESDVIGPVIRGALSLGAPVVVVDDCSTDSTGAQITGAWVLRHPINLGQGAALQSGISFARSHGATHVVTFDADGQHRVADVQELVKRMHSTGADMVCGSRFLGAATGMALGRRLILKLAILFQRITSGIWLTDAHNGLRLIGPKALAVINLQEDRMAHASEIIDQVLQSGLRIQEAPVTIDYTAYSVAKGQRSSDAVGLALNIIARKLLP